MIRNIVFDIGGVLADFRMKEFLLEKGFDGPMIRRILKASVMSPYWEKFERGELTEEETLEGFASIDPEIGEELRRAYFNIEGMLTARAFSIPLIKRLKDAGLGVYYLSNNTKKAYDECAGSLDFMPFMDGGLVSFLAGRTKPDPEMYRMFLEKFGLRAEECVFVDDTPENVAAAETLGFTGIVFKSPEALDAALKELTDPAGRKERLLDAFEFRQVRQEEAEETAMIEKICFPPNEACSREQMEQRVRSVPELFLVAEDKKTGKIAGFLNGIATSEERFRDAFFTDSSLYDPEGENVMLCGLDVLPEYRGQGLAAELVRQYAEREKKRGRKRLILTCLASKVGMYQKFGFTDRGLADSTWGGESWHEMDLEIRRS